MRSLSALLILALQAALWNEGNASRTPLDSDKELIMLEIEPTTRDDRSKRSPEGSGLRFVRQTHSIPPEYLSLLQQLSPQQAAQQQIQQLVVARDGSKQPAAARYVLSQDGRIVQESLGLQALQQQQQFLQIPQQGQPQPGAPVLTPELEAFSRAQTQLQQDYHDAPIRAQIAGLTERPDALADSLRNPPPPGGPGSPAPQIFSQAANQALSRHEARLRTQLQQDPSLGQFQLVDANGYLQQFGQQQFAQPQLTQQPLSVASADTGRQLTSLYDQTPRQRVVYQAAQPAPQSQPQAQPAYTPKLPASRRPIGPSAQAQLAPSTQPQLVQQQQHSQLLQQQQPQLLQQDFPQQYLLETSRPSSAQYLDALSRQDQQRSQGDSAYASLFSNPGRGLFSPAAPENKPSRSSIFVSRSGAKAAAPTEEQLPTVRIPAPANQRPLSRAELDALVNAGFSITPVGSEEPQAGLLKAKRTPLPLARRNHVIYQNQQDGVSYQYSPGSSDYNPATKTKRYAPKHELNNVYRANTGRQGVVTYVMALGKQAE